MHVCIIMVLSRTYINRRAETKPYLHTCKLSIDLDSSLLRDKIYSSKLWCAGSIQVVVLPEGPHTLNAAFFTINL